MAQVGVCGGVQGYGEEGIQPLMKNLTFNMSFIIFFSSWNLALRLMT